MRLFFPFMTADTYARHLLQDYLSAQCSSQEEYNYIIDLVGSMSCERVRELLSKIRPKE